MTLKSVETQVEITYKKSIVETVGSLLGIPASTINNFKFFFQSLILEVGVFVLAFYIGKIPTVKKEKSQSIKREDSTPQVYKPQVYKPQNEIDGARVKEIRTELGKSQSELAIDLGIQQRKLSRIENSQATVDKTLAQKLVNMNIL